MRKWVGAVAVAGVLAATGGPGAGVALADDMKMGPTCAPAGTSLALTAQDHKFDKDCLAVPAGETFTIRFDNKDADRHNVAILPSHTSTETLFQGDILPGPKSSTYSVPALKGGTYHFHCEVHPNLMNGTFIVAAGPGAPAAAPAPATAATPAPAPAPTTSMADDKAAAKPAPGPAAGPTEPAPMTAATPAPARSAASAAAPKAAAAALPRTGPQSARLLLLLAGIAFAVGGLSVVGGARRAEG
jgi:plastocyanin